jgi:hypothetical protein
MGGTVNEKMGSTHKLKTLKTLKHYRHLPIIIHTAPILLAGGA